MPSNEMELTLAKQWAIHIATPVFVIDEAGKLVFYNEPAERLLGRPYSTRGELPLDELPITFDTRGPDGRPLAFDELPIGRALLRREPAHGALTYTAHDDRATTRHIAVTAVPLQRRDGSVLGALALFWETPAAAGR